MFSAPSKKKESTKNGNYDDLDELYRCPSQQEIQQAMLRNNVGGFNLFQLKEILDKKPNSEPVNTPSTPRKA